MASILTVPHLSRIVSRYSSPKILRSADIEMVTLNLTLENINICELAHVFLPRRVVARRQRVASSKNVRLRQGYGATVFALCNAASEDWSLGDSNP